jgi:hypothetical protein
MHVFALSVICDELVLFQGTYVYSVSVYMLHIVLEVCRLFLLIPPLLLHLWYLFSSVNPFCGFMFLFPCNLKWDLLLLLKYHFPVFFNFIIFVLFVIFLYAVSSFIFNHLLHTNSSFHFFVSDEFNYVFASSPFLSEIPIQRYFTYIWVKLNVWVGLLGPCTATYSGTYIQVKKE